MKNGSKGLALKMNFFFLCTREKDKKKKKQVRKQVEKILISWSLFMKELKFFVCTCVCVLSCAYACLLERIREIFLLEKSPRRQHLKNFLS